MINKFIMTGMATLLAFQVAVADDVQTSKKHVVANNSQHKLVKPPLESENSNKAKKVTRISVDAIMDFQFVMPKNKDEFKHSAGEQYVARLHEITAQGGDQLVENPSTLSAGDADNVKLMKDGDGGILGDYAKDNYYSTNALVSVKLEQVIGKNISIGGVVELLAPISGDKFNHFSSAIQNKGSYIFFKHPYLVMNAGAVVGAEQVMKINSHEWSAADGGVSGDWVRYANLEGSYSDAMKDATNVQQSKMNRNAVRPFYISPTLYSQHYGAMSSQISNKLGIVSLGGDPTIAPKISIYSRDFKGIKAGISYASGYSQNSQMSKGKQQYYNIADYKNIFGAGVTYEKDMGKYSVKVALAGEVGKAVQEEDYNDLSAVSFGGIVKYKNMITVGGEYGFLGKSGLSKKYRDYSNLSAPAVLTDAKPSNTNYINIGAAYDMGPARISAGYYRSVQNPYTETEDYNSVMNDFNVGAHYNLTHGCKKTQFTPYVAYHHFTTDEKGKYTTPTANNSGNVFMMGLKATF